MKEVIRLAAILMVICAVSAGVLAYTNDVTSKIIAERIQKEKIELLQRLFPTVTRYEDKEAEGRTATLGYDEQDKLVGILAEGKTSGYGGEIRFNLAIDGEGKLVAVNIISHSETAGLGAKITNESYLEQFVGKTANDDFDVDNISGATISSLAMENGVQSEMQAILLAFGGDIVQTPAEIDITKIPDGVYTGEGKGLKPGIKVEVTVEGGKITDIKVLEGNDTPEYFNQAKAQIPKRIIEQQEIDVDVSSGASFSSRGIMEAVRNALQGAAGAPVERELDISAVPDGVYTGEGKGLKPGIKVEVTVEGGKITDIKVLESNDTPEYFNQAKAQVPKRIIEQQSVQVDAASGASFSSKGIMEAVKNALLQQ